MRKRQQPAICGGRRKHAILHAGLGVRRREAEGKTEVCAARRRATHWWFSMSLCWQRPWAGLAAAFLCRPGLGDSRSAERANRCLRRAQTLHGLSGSFTRPVDEEKKIGGDARRSAILCSGHVKRSSSVSDSGFLLRSSGEQGFWIDFESRASKHLRQEAMSASFATTHSSPLPRMYVIMPISQISAPVIGSRLSILLSHRGVLDCINIEPQLSHADSSTDSAPELGPPTTLGK